MIFESLWGTISLLHIIVQLGIGDPGKRVLPPLLGMHLMFVANEQPSQESMKCF